MEVRFGVELSSHGRLLRVFERLGRVVGDPRLRRDVAEEIVRRTKARFQTKKSPEGLPWKPWSTAYAATRSADKSLLIDTGDLERGIEARVAGERVSIGVADASYAVHVHRTRPFMGIGPEEEREIMDMIEDRMMEALDAVA